MEGLKVVIFSRTYSKVVGGVEKLSLKLAKRLLALGITVHLVSFDDPNATMFFDVPTGLVWHKVSTPNIDQKSNWRIRYRRVRDLRLLLRKIQPDVFIGFQVGTFLLMRIAAVGLRISSIAAERNAPTLFNFIKLGRAKYWFYQLALHSASIITVQFSEYKTLYLPSLHKRIRVTPNPVEIPNEFMESRRPGDKLRILFIGRLTFQKNIEVLLQALQTVESKSLVLTVVGEGPSIKNLRSMALMADLEVHFEPFNKSLKTHFFDHDVFCLPSRWEGFPNVVAEALAHGLPIIGFSECAGVSSLVKPGINGELASGNSDPITLGNTLRNFDPSIYSKRQIVDSVRQYDEQLFEHTWVQAVVDSLKIVIPVNVKNSKKI